MAVIDIIVEEVEQFKEDLIEVIRKRNLVDTQKAINSLRVVKSENSVSLIGVDYLYFLDKGSKPWSDKSLKSKRKLGYILQVSGWAKRKGVNPYAVASVIVDSGSQIFRGKKSGIELDNLISDFRNRLQKRLIFYSSLEIKRNLDKFTKQFNQNQRTL